MLTQTPMVPDPYYVVRLQQENRDTVTIELAPTSGMNPLRFEPGQFNMLYTWGKGEIPISLSGDAQYNRTLVHTIRAVGAISQTMTRFEIGDVLGLRGPFGKAWPIEALDSKDIVLVAGGIGLAPLRPVIYHLLANRKKYGLVHVLYGARSPKDLLFETELRQWRGRFDMNVDITVDHSMGDWYGNVGVVTKLIDSAHFDASETVALICGPEIMMRFATKSLQKRGVPFEQMYVSLERNMKCGIGLCGHCQLGPTFICRDGPVFRFDQIQTWLNRREL